MPKPPDFPPDDGSSGPVSEVSGGSFDADRTAGVDGGAFGEARADGAGRYTRDGLLGRGGMGIVYLARDHRLGRVVALKEAARGGEIADRLAREARVTAGLDHPGIVTVHDSGVTEDGRPFYTMRLVRGRALSAVLDERPRLEERLALVRHYLDACEAVAYAHAEGLAHGDLKPANIMVGGFGETQVVDWGLAVRLRDAAVDGAPAPTSARPGNAVGTPAYMSPEQARGEPVGPTSDVWSLGAVLYEILSGRRPRGSGTSDEVLARARRGEQPPPLETGPPELIAITERALSSDVVARYPNAGALAADVAAWLEGRLVAAYRYTPREMFVRLVRAWRAPIVVAGIALAVGVALVIGGTTRLARERDLVATAEREARAALATSDANLAKALVAEARTAMREGSPAVAAVLASHAVALADAPEAWGVLAGVSAEARAERVEEGPLPQCERVLLIDVDDVLCFTMNGVDRVTRGAVAWSWRGEVGATSLQPDRLFVAQPDFSVLALALDTGVATAGWQSLGLPSGRIWPVRARDWGVAEEPLMPNRLVARFCPGSAMLAAAEGVDQRRWAIVCEDGRVGEAAVGALPERYFPTSATRAALAGVMAAELAPDGRLVVGGSKGALVVIDPATEAVWTASTVQRDAAGLLAVSADSRRVAVGGDRGEIEIRTLPELGLVATLPVTARAAIFAADGSLLVAEADSVSRWRLPTGTAATVFRGPDGLTAATFSPDGAHLATAHGRFEGRMWDLASGAVLATLPLGTGTAKGAAFTPDGAVAWFALVGARGGWRPEPLRVDGLPSARLGDALLPLAVTGEPNFSARRIVVLRSGALLALGYDLGALLVVDTRTRLPLTPVDCPSVQWFDAGQSPGGERAVLVGSGGRVVPVTAEPVLRCDAGFTRAGTASADIAADGTLALATEHEVSLTDAAGTVRWEAPWPGGRVLDVAISGDGRWVAAGGSDHLARVWDATGRLRAVLSGHAERVASVDFRPDARMLVTGSWDGTARLWGLDVLDVPGATLDARAATDWGLTLDEALGAAGR